MSTELEQTRDHARRMAEGSHLAVCCCATGITRLNCGITTEHQPHEWAPTITAGRITISGNQRRCYGLCFGCMDDSERALWKRMADEMDAYLSMGIDEQETLI